MDHHSEGQIPNTRDLSPKSVPKLPATSQLQITQYWKINYVVGSRTWFGLNPRFENELQSSNTLFPGGEKTLPLKRGTRMA